MPAPPTAAHHAQRLRVALAQAESARVVALEELSAARRERDRLQGERDSLRDELRFARAEATMLRERLKGFMRRLFVARSEARGSEQRDLFFNEAEALVTVPTEEVVPPVAPPAPAGAAAQTPARPRAPRGRRPLSPELPREVVRHELPDSERQCPHDGTALVEIGVEASEQLDILPPQVRVLRHERVKYACPCCDGGLTTAAAPARIIPKGLLSAGALAYVVTAKYLDALPLYRQAALLGRFGGEFSRGTLAASVVRVGQAVQPLVNLMQDRLLAADLILGDETVVQVLKEPNRAAATKSFMWVRASGFDTGPPIRLFDYDPSRSAATALRLYAGVKPGAALLTDGYDAYGAVARGNGLQHLGCWAHARRYFVQAEEVVPKAARVPSHPATRMLAPIGELYAVEAQARELSVEQRTQRRQTDTRAALARIETLLQEQLHTVVPGSLLGRALHYLAGQWPKLVRFVEHGAWPIGRVGMWRGGGRLGLSVGRPFRLAVPEYPRRGSVSTSPSSNRTCGLPASGSLPTHQAFAFEQPRASGRRRISPNVS